MTMGRKKIKTTQREKEMGFYLSSLTVYMNFDHKNKVMRRQWDVARHRYAEIFNVSVA